MKYPRCPKCTKEMVYILNGKYICTNGQCRSCDLKSIKTTIDTNTILYTILLKRYKELAKGCKNEAKINDMMELVVKNCKLWPQDKTGRWVGYVQCLLIEVEGVTTVNNEREFTRPLFHSLYKSQGLEIPESVEV